MLRIVAHASHAKLAEFTIAPVEAIAKVSTIGQEEKFPVFFCCIAHQASWCSECLWRGFITLGFAVGPYKKSSNYDQHCGGSGLLRPSPGTLQRMPQQTSKAFLQPQCQH